MAGAFGEIVILFVVLGISIIAIPNYLRFYGDLIGGKVTTDLEGEYDYIVIGASPTGSVVSSRLSERSDLRVLLLEAGEEETINPMYHVPGASGDHFGTRHSWDFYTEPQAEVLQWRNDGQPERLIGGKMLGGSSTINAMQYTRGSTHDFDLWEAEGCLGWGYKDVLPYFLKSEDAQSSTMKDSKFHTMGGFLGVTENRDHPLANTFLNAGKELEYEVIDHNSEKNIGFSYIYTNVKNNERSSPVRHLLREAMMRNNLHVSVRSHVTKVIIEEKKAVGVEVIINNQKKRVRANKEVIVSAGAIGSPKVLMLSGIGPSDQLQKFNIPVVADLPVGQTLRDHIGLPLWTNANYDDRSLLPDVDYLQYLLFRTGRLAQANGGGTAFLTDDGSLDRRPDVQINMYYNKIPFDSAGLCRSDNGDISKGPGFTALIFFLHPSCKGYLTLRSGDPFDAPVLAPQYKLSKTDISKMIFAVRTVGKIWNTNAFRPYNTSISLNKVPFCSLLAFDSDAFWGCYIRNMMFSGHHQTGTCKMGSRNDVTSVVDFKLKVKGVEALRVMDASIFPHEHSGNPAATCVMIGEKGADLILQDLNTNV